MEPVAESRGLSTTFFCAVLWVPEPPHVSAYIDLSPFRSFLFSCSVLPRADCAMGEYNPGLGISKRRRFDGVGVRVGRLLTLCTESLLQNGVATVQASAKDGN